jgi:hypothetical protein
VKSLELCSGSGNVSKALKNAGWDTTTVDINPDFSPDYCMDVRSFVKINGGYNFIWASPPCTEYAREFMPWCKTGAAIDMTIWRHCLWLIQSIRPQYWIIENVRGAVPYWGSPRQVIGPYFLWGYFPRIAYRGPFVRKEHLSSSADAARGAIPPGLAEAVVKAIQTQKELL